MKVPKITLFLIIIFISAFAFSILGFEFYVNGDQIAYSNFYSSLHNSTFFEAYKNQAIYVSAIEPIAAFIFWIGAILDIEKNIYISIWNAILILLIVKFLKKNRVNVIQQILICFGYYILVLFFAAERLKFAIIFLLIALLYTQKKKIYGIFAFLCHSSVIVYMGSFLLDYLSKKRIIAGLLFIIFINLILIFFPNYINLIFNKVSFGRNSNFFDFLPSLLILIDLLLLNKKNPKKNIFIELVPIVLFIFVLGPTRLNMLIYFYYVFYCVKHRYTSSIIFNLTLIYNFYKSSIFISNTLQYGEGFNVI
tara:strand:- start:7643 stop:8566 length:924 start_codon:yes stop_codon:yes gene_type:complete